MSATSAGRRGAGRRGEARAGEARAGEARAGEARAGEARAGEERGPGLEFDAARVGDTVLLAYGVNDCEAKYGTISIDRVWSSGACFGPYEPTSGVTGCATTHRPVLPESAIASAAQPAGAAPPLPPRRSRGGGRGACRKRGGELTQLLNRR